jgi:hypothetical protein
MLGASKAFGSREGNMQNGARREVELGVTAFVHNFEFCYLPVRGALGEILMLIRGATLGRNFHINVVMAA